MTADVAQSHATNIVTDLNMGWAKKVYLLLLHSLLMPHDSLGAYIYMDEAAALSSLMSDVGRDVIGQLYDAAYFEAQAVRVLQQEPYWPSQAAASRLLAERLKA